MAILVQMNLIARNGTVVWRVREVLSIYRSFLKGQRKDHKTVVEALGGICRWEISSIVVMKRTRREYLIARAFVIALYFSLMRVIARVGCKCIFSQLVFNWSSGNLLKMRWLSCHMNLILLVRKHRVI